LQEEAKRVLQLAAVIGRIFLRRVLAAIAEEERELDGHLVTLQREEMIRERARLPELEYIFKHELTREAAYNGLLKKERRVFHRQVAEALERLFSERIEEQVGLLAHHWERAEEPEKAIHYLYQAGEQARRQYANEEAINYFRRALALLEDTPPDASRQRAATKLYESLGDVLELTGQHGEAKDTYQHALAEAPKQEVILQARLCRKIGNTYSIQYRYDDALRAWDKAETALGQEPVEAKVQWWQEWVQIQLDRLWLCYLRGRVQEISQLVEKSRSLVERYGTPSQRAAFFVRLVLLAYRRDRYVVSQETLAHARTALAASQESDNLSEIGFAQFVLGFTHLWHGDLDEAEEQMLAGLKLAERAGDVTLQSRYLTYLAVLYRKRGQVEETRRYISRSLAVATTGQMLEYIGAAKANQAWIAWREGNLTEVQEKGRTTLEVFQKIPTFPMQWLYRWPLIGAALMQDELSEAIEHARALLPPPQQLLPTVLTSQVEQAIDAWEGGRLEETRTRLRQAIELAQEMGYL